MAQPSAAAAEIDERKRDGDDDERESPAQQSPVRIGLCDEANGEKKRSAENDERDWNRGCSRHRGRRPIPPTFPKHVKGKERNDQTIIVLRIKPPLGFELVDELGPNKAEDNEHDEPARFPGAPRRNSDGLRNGLVHLRHSVAEPEQLASRLGEHPPRACRVLDQFQSVISLETICVCVSLRLDGAAQPKRLSRAGELGRANLGAGHIVEFVRCRS